MTVNGLKTDERNVDEMASYWLVRLTASDCSPEERCAFEAWKEEDPAHEDAYLRLQRGGALFDRHLGDPQIQALADRALKETAPSFWRRRPFQYAAIAASLILAVGVAVSLNTGAGFNREPAGQTIASVERYETAIGERSTVALPDGSVITLNTNSLMEVDFTTATRSVRLLKGQGFFEVAKDVGRPFIVTAGDKRVVALGTAFDVRFDKADVVEVTLVEGLVEVAGLDAPEPAENASAFSEADQSKVRLNPGERLIAKAETAPAVQKTDAIEETSWRTGKLIFRDRALSAVVEEMNRYSTQRLVLDSDDVRLAEMRVSGSFNAGRATTFVDALEVMHPLKATRTGENELTLVWQD